MHSDQSPTPIRVPLDELASPPDELRRHLRERRGAPRVVSPRLVSPRGVAGTAVALLVAVGVTIAFPALAAAAPTAAQAIASAAAPEAGAQTLSRIRTDAQGTLSAARAALTEASEVGADIAASGLDLGGDTSIATTTLESAAERLEEFDLVPALLVPGLATEAATAADEVSARVADLRGRLEAAEAQWAAEQAAAASAAEAQRQAEAAAAAAAALAAANTPEGARATARHLAASQYGWGEGQFSCLESLWTKESGWDYQAYNAGSGATGIPQSLPGNKMASAGADWQTSAATQIAWGLGYIAGSYGTPCAAWGHSQATDWY